MPIDDRRLIADEAAAERIARARGLYDQLFPPRRALSLTELEAAYVAGELTDEDMGVIFLEVHDRAPTVECALVAPRNGSPSPQRGTSV